MRTEIKENSLFHIIILFLFASFTDISFCVLALQGLDWDDHDDFDLDELEKIATDDAFAVAQALAGETIDLIVCSHRRCRIVDIFLFCKV